MAPWYLPHWKIAGGLKTESDGIGMDDQLFDNLPGGNRGFLPTEVFSHFFWGFSHEHHLKSTYISDFQLPRLTTQGSNGQNPDRVLWTVNGSLSEIWQVWTNQRRCLIVMDDGWWYVKSGTLVICMSVFFNKKSCKTNLFAGILG